jgi:hypothetical protein
MNITREWLENDGACASGRKEFDRVFPKGMRLTRKNLMKAVKSSGINKRNGALLLDMYWFFQSFKSMRIKENRNKLNSISRNIGMTRAEERNMQYKIAKLIANELKLK